MGFIVRALQVTVFVTVAVWCRNRAVEGFAPVVIGAVAAWLLTVAPVLAWDASLRGLRRLAVRAFVGHARHDQVVGHGTRAIAVRRHRA